MEPNSHRHLSRKGPQTNQNDKTQTPDSKNQLRLPLVTFIFPAHTYLTSLFKLAT